MHFALLYSIERRYCGRREMRKNMQTINPSVLTSMLFYGHVSSIEFTIECCENQEKIKMLYRCVLYIVFTASKASLLLLGDIRRAFCLYYLQRNINVSSQVRLAISLENGFDPMAESWWRVNFCVTCKVSTDPFFVSGPNRTSYVIRHGGPK